MRSAYRISRTFSFFNNIYRDRGARLNSDSHYFTKCVTLEAEDKMCNYFPARFACNGFE